MLHSTLARFGLVSAWSRWAVIAIAAVCAVSMCRSIFYKPEHFLVTRPASAAFADSNGLVPADGNVHVGTWLYRDGERVGWVREIRGYNPVNHEWTPTVIWDSHGTEQVWPMDLLVQRFRVRPDGQ